MIPRIAWPDGKDFAFTIFDDPDWDTVESTATVYSFLTDLGLRTTKAVWPLRGNRTPKIGGATCEDEQYLRLNLSLQAQGFEIAFHNATYHTSIREETKHGLEVFCQLFGHYPFSMANHMGCEEGIYWGNARLSGAEREVYNVINLSKHNAHQGHVESSPLFWGDYCREMIKYVRNFQFGEIDTLKACPFMPYHDSERPYVNYWFSSSDGSRVKEFNSVLCEENQDILAMNGGACIMYTHFGAGFVERGRLNTRFKYLMERIGRMNGWFVPVRTLMDFILQARGRHVITSLERSALQRRWLWYKLIQARGRT